MSTYAFRLRFLLPTDSIISDDSNEIEIQLNPEVSSTIRLLSNDGKPLKESHDLSIRGNGFPSEIEAHTRGIRVKNALIFCATQLQIGIDCGKDKSRSAVAKFIKDRAKELGWLLLDNVHGLSVYQDDLPVRIFGANASLTTGKTSARFTEEFKKAYELSLNFSDKLLLAFELYGASHFEISIRARFVSLITAIESICVQGNHSVTVLNYLDELIKFTNANFDDPEKNNIVNGLARLKIESVISACKKIVAANLGVDAAKQFAKLYNIRSRILHDGRTPEGVDLDTEVPKLDKMVSDLLLRIACGL